MYKLLPDFAATAINCVSLNLWSLTKDFFTIHETRGSWNVLLYERQRSRVRLNTSPKYRKTKTIYIFLDS